MDKEKEVGADTPLRQQVQNRAGPALDPGRFVTGKEGLVERDVSAQGDSPT